MSGQVRPQEELLRYLANKRRTRIMWAHAGRKQETELFCISRKLRLSITSVPQYSKASALSILLNLRKANAGTGRLLGTVGED